MSGFKSVLNPPNVISESCSKHIFKEYGFDISNYGEAKIVEKGKVDIYALIQTNADNVDLTKILNEVRSTGDFSLLDKNKGVYGDIREVPTSFIESENLSKKIKLEAIDELKKTTGLDISSLSEKDIKNLDKEKLQNMLISHIMKNKKTVRKESKLNE